MQQIASLIIIAALLITCPVAAQQSEALPQTYSTPSGGFSIDYPADWIAQGIEKNGVVLVSIASSSAILQRKGVELADDDVLIQAGTLKSTSLLNAAQATLKGLSGKTRFKCQGKTAIEERVAQQTEIIGTDSDSLSVTIDFGKGVFAFLTLQTSSGKLDQWRATALAMAASIRLKPASTLNKPETKPAPVKLTVSDLPQFYNATFLDGETHLVFCYPAGWIVRSADKSQRSEAAFLDVTLASNSTLLTKDFKDTFAAGDVKMRLWMGLSRGFLGAQTNLQMSVDDALAECLKGYCGVSSFKIGTIKLISPTIASVQVNSDGAEGMILVNDMGYSLYRVIYLYTAPGELDSWIPASAAIAGSLTICEKDKPCLTG